MLRADVCNAVDELGQLLDHGAGSRIRSATQHVFSTLTTAFVTSGTSTSNKSVWHANVASDDVVVVDRNCHNPFCTPSP